MDAADAMVTETLRRASREQIACVSLCDNLIVVRTPPHRSDALCALTHVLGVARSALDVAVGRSACESLRLTVDAIRGPLCHLLIHRGMYGADVASVRSAYLDLSEHRRKYVRRAVRQTDPDDPMYKHFADGAQTVRDALR